MMTEEKMQKVQRKLDKLCHDQNLAPDEAIGMFVSAALGIMQQVYKQPDGTSITLDDAKMMLANGVADSVKRNGTPTPSPLTIVDTPKAAADHLAKVASDADNIENAKPISVEEALERLEKGYEPPGSELK